ncbi:MULTISPECIES: lytic transglycosylase domain-containing protein [unclassified Thioalkalivibrio]|uniref:lytic transglycosylase domain-containing protein n=1 Tax=unclassified Thioalkalivibrio TaxID=2621013 RepID=UPI000382F2CB|nr:MULTISPECIES: lytic transglycosylase domain-containing protein [unclassified Thioalkalivibrio]
MHPSHGKHSARSALRLLALLSGLVLAGNSAAELYSYRDASGARVLTDERPHGVPYETIRSPARTGTAATTTRGGDWSPSQIFVFQGPDGERLVTNQHRQDNGMELVATYGRPTARARCGARARHALATGGGEFADLIHAAANRQGVDPALVQSVIHVESCFDPQAVSRVGAYGLMQLMPATAADLGVTDRFDPAQNIDGGTRYLAAMLDRFEGNLELALAAYNAGPGAVERHGGVPPFRETQNYIQRIRAQYAGNGRPD